MRTPEQIEAQLQQRIAHYPATKWGRKQADAWDKQTNFIYRIERWDALSNAVKKLEKPVADYAVNRWFNFWSAKAIETIFCTLPGVSTQVNDRDRLVDFSIQGINFDHKTSVFPKRYGHSLAFAQSNRAHLIKWLYQNQSRQQRYHTANRLFVVLYARHGEHWRLRAEISQLEREITNYVTTFDASKLVRLSAGERTILSDIIWFVR